MKSTYIVKLGLHRGPYSHRSSSHCTHKDFRHYSEQCPLQQISNDSAIVGCVSEVDQQHQYRGVIADCVERCEENRLLLNTSKHTELVMDVCRASTPHTPVKIQHWDIEVVVNRELHLSHNIDALYRKGQSS